MFKIQRKSDGLFSTGGTSPRWSKTGKIWKQRGHVTAHLGLVNNRVYLDAVIIEYEMAEKDRQPASEWMHVVQMKRDQQEKERAERIAAYKKSLRREEYKRLKEEFENEDLS